MEQPPKQLYENSFFWKIFCASNYFLGGILFLVGSILFFPTLTDIMILDTISIWCFIIGSFNFVLADGMVGWHWIEQGKKYIEITLNCGVSMISIGAYLVGSVFLLPSVNWLRAGIILFLVGSYFLCLSEGWKLFRLLRPKNKTFKEIIEEKGLIFLMDILFSTGAITFLAGSYTFDEEGTGIKLEYATAIFFTFGSACFFVGCGVLFKFYFEQKQQKGAPLLSETKSENNMDKDIEYSITSEKTSSPGHLKDENLSKNKSSQNTTGQRSDQINKFSSFNVSANNRRYSEIL